MQGGYAPAAGGYQAPASPSYQAPAAPASPAYQAPAAPGPAGVSSYQRRSDAPAQPASVQGFGAPAPEDDLPF